MRSLNRCIVLPLCALFVVNPSFADDTPQDLQALEEVIVHSHPLSAEGLSQAVEVVEGKELLESLGTSIGETLERLPGIHSSGFGKAVGRPVIHGLAGPRVRMMEDRIDTMDVSVTSADHAVGIDPFIVDRVEVLKGASTLLYGSGAIGGVVDMHTGRIPHSVPDNKLSGGMQLRHDSNTDGTAVAGKLNGGSGNIAFHADFSSKRGDAYKIPGEAESAALHALEEAEGEDEGNEEEGHEEEGSEGVLEGSQFESDAWALGVSHVFEHGFYGVAVSRLESSYGLPGGHGHEHEEEEGEEEEGEEGTPVLDLAQTKIDFELGLENPFGPFDSLNVRAAFNDYEHDEVEPSGEVATNFTNKAWEARAELVNEGEAWHTVFGLQANARDFSSAGEEAFVAGVESTELAGFVLAERSFNAFDLEVGARYGQVEHDPEIGGSTDFASWAVSAGLVRPLTDSLQIGLLLDVSSRAPVGEELYANGAHLATQTFELGNIDLNEERAANLSATIDWKTERFEARSTVYHIRFEDFIYQQSTGVEMEELPVQIYQQDDAEFTGVDAEFTVNLNPSWSINAMFDLVRAELSDTGENLPRIPAARYGLGLAAELGKWSINVDALQVAKQNRNASTELPTDSYLDVSAGVYLDLSQGDGTEFIVFAKAKNLGDREQRQHTSFIKEFAPQPGRSIEVGVSIGF